MCSNNGDACWHETKLFKLEYNASMQGFYIIPKANEAWALDVANYSTADGAELIFAGKAPNINRFFLAEKVSYVISSLATYQDNGNYPHTVTDSRGNTTTYTYDTKRGLQTGVTNAKGGTTEYTYNSKNDRLENVKTGDSAVTYQYNTVGMLQNITSPSGTAYHFNYDMFGRQKQIMVGSRLLSETIYRDNYLPLVSRFNYGNGTYKTYAYDDQDRLISESINGTVSRKYLYDKSGNTAKIEDLLANVTTKYSYDLIGRAVRIQTSDGQNLNVVYDKYNRLSLSKWTLGNHSFSSGYIYGDSAVSGQKTGLIYGVNLNGTQKLGYQYDELARLQTRAVGAETPFVTEYMYLEGKDGNTTTTLVKSVKNGADTWEYTYDELGNITTVSRNGMVTEQYSYDALNQLKSAVYGGDTYQYFYDNGGNLTEIKKNNEVIKSYSYGDSEWKDLLTSFNGQAITYDAIGNPLAYRNGMTFTWQNGRQLSGISKDGAALASYTYNADGLRTSKTVNGVTTEYYWLNGILQGQKTGEEYLFFLYDESGRAYGFVRKNGTKECIYYYEFNVQGDIIGIIDSTGTKVVEYTYGAWGDLLSVSGTLADTIGQRNPLRYRRYYYDTETGFYYLTSRYYDAETGRFVNADGYVSTGQDLNGFNMFSYCGNNPVNRIDPTGLFWKEIGQFLSNAWNGVKKLAKKTFGASAALNYQTKQETELMPQVLNVFLTIKNGIKENKTIESVGDSSKPVSVYANGRSDNYIASSAGLNLNISKITFNANLGIENIGISGSLKNKNGKKSFGVSIDISQLKVGIEWANTVTVKWDNSTTVTNYTNVSITGMGLLATYMAVETGQWEPLQYAY